MPIIVPFYKDNGLDAKNVFALQAVYSIAVVILEIPSGYIADVWGRKKTIVAGSSLGFFGFLVYSLSGGFYGFLLAEIILGFGQSLISGADSAILYDSLLEIKKENQYTKMEGRITAIGNFAEAIAGVIGGILATISLRTPFYFQTGVAFLAVPASIMLIEPHQHKLQVGISLRHFFSIIHWCLFKNMKVRDTILYSSIIGTSTLTMAWFVQFYFQQVNIPLAFYGILWPGLNMLVGITSLYAYRLELQLGQKRTILLILLSLIAIYISLGWIHSFWGISLLVIFYLVRGIATPILKDYINRLTESKIRATVLSVRSFVIRIFFAICGPILGWMTSKISLAYALTSAGIVFLISGGIFALLLLFKKRSGDSYFSSSSSPS